MQASSARPITSRAPDDNAQVAGYAAASQISTVFVSPPGHGGNISGRTTLGVDHDEIRNEREPKQLKQSGQILVP